MHVQCLVKGLHLRPQDSMTPNEYCFLDTSFPMLVRFDALDQSNHEWARCCPVRFLMTMPHRPFGHSRADPLFRTVLVLPTVQRVAILIHKTQACTIYSSTNLNQCLPQRLQPAGLHSKLDCNCLAPVCKVCQVDPLRSRFHRQPRHVSLTSIDLL